MKQVQSSIASVLTGTAQKNSNPTFTQHNSVCTVEEVEVNAPPQENSGDEENSDVDRDASSGLLKKKHPPCVFLTHRHLHIHTHENKYTHTHTHTHRHKHTHTPTHTNTHAHTDPRYAM